MHLFFFFFFQAEDGIRDLTVTGVQTCALPPRPARGARPLERAGRGRPRATRASSPRRRPSTRSRPAPRAASPCRPRATRRALRSPPPRGRAASGTTRSRPSRRPPPDELANGLAVRHEDRVGGGEEEIGRAH